MSGAQADVGTEPQLLAGRYALEAVLGSGGHAVVYAAHDELLARPVAVKVLRARFAADPRMRAAFRWEGNAAAAIVHPNVARVYDAGSDGQVEFIAMELVEGRSLSELIADRERLDVAEAVGLAADVAAALQAAHERGLVHRDIKPGNVIVTPDGRAKVVDFGIMRSIDRHDITETLGVFGTAAYLSPEQATGLPVDGRTDLYSLGCVLYEMLVGRPPFAEGSPMAICAQHVYARPEAPSRLRPDLSPAVEAVVLRALEKDPEDRFPTVSDMRRTLLASIGASERPAPAPPTTTVTPAARSLAPVAAGLSSGAADLSSGAAADRRAAVVRDAVDSAAWTRSSSPQDSPARTSAGSRRRTSPSRPTRSSRRG